MQEDGPMCVDDGHGAGLKAQDNQEGSTGSAADVQSDVQSHRDITNTTCHASPSATCLNIYSPNAPEP